MAKRTEPTEEQFVEFDKARKLYPGVKRGRDTEFARLKMHKDWPQIIPLLYRAIENQIRRRKNKQNARPPEFIPPWKHFKTWLNNRCWEETEGTEVDPRAEKEKRESAIKAEKQKYREEYSSYLRERFSVGELKELLTDHRTLIPKWLIKEIIEERQVMPDE